MQASSTPKTAKGARQYASLLAAATTLFAQRGYQGASLQDIAASLGLIKASVYHYVSSKDDLLFAILETIHTDFRGNLADAKVTSADTEGTLRAFVEGHLRVVLARQEQLRIFERDFDQLSEDRRALITAQRDEYDSHFTDLVESYVRDGSTGADPWYRLEAATVLAQMNAVRVPADLRAADPEDLVQRITNLIMGGLDHLRTQARNAPDEPAGPPASLREKEGDMPRTVSSVLLDAYHRYAERPALRNVDGSVLLTYAQLRDRALAIAGWLHSVGAGPGSNVVILTDNRAEFFEAEHGTFLAGGRRIALGDRLHENEVVAIMKDCRPPVVFASARWAARLVEQRAELDFIDRIVCWDDGGDPVPDTVAYTSVTTAARPDLKRLPTPEEEDIAALIYTSGSTGDAKGVLLSHRAWLGMTDLTVAELPAFGDDDTMLHVAPLSHMAGYHALPLFLHGGSHIVARKFNAAEALRAIEDLRITTTALVPTILNELVTQQAATAADLSSLKSVIYGGARISAVQLRGAIEVFGSKLRQFYGLSEIPILSCLGAREHDPFGTESGKYLSSAGRVLPGVELKIVDEDGTTLGHGATGEIIARSKTSMSGYLNLRETTRKTLLPGGWVRTGDVGELDDENYLYIRDRIKDVVITGGYNVYTAEVENVLAAAAGVADIAVFGVPDERWGEVVVAAIVPALGADPDVDSLASFCAERIARYKVPKHFVFLDDLPVSAAGKIDRRALAESMLPRLTRNSSV